MEKTVIAPTESLKISVNRRYVVLTEEVYDDGTSVWTTHQIGYSRQHVTSILRAVAKRITKNFNAPEELREFSAKRVNVHRICCTENAKFRELIEQKNVTLQDFLSAHKNNKVAHWDLELVSHSYVKVQANNL